MAQRIRNIDPVQAAKVVAVLYLMVGLVLVPIFLFLAFMDSNAFGFGMGFAIFIPVFYAVIGFIGTIIFCALYNLVAGWVGGIEVEFE